MKMDIWSNKQVPSGEYCIIFTKNPILACGKIRGIPAGLTAEVVCPENNNSENITCFQPGCRRQKTARIPGGNTPIWGEEARNPGGNTSPDFGPDSGRKYSDLGWESPEHGRGHPIFRRERHGFGRQYTDFRTEASRIPGKSVPDPGKHAQDRSRVSLPQSFPGHPGVRGLRSADTTELCPKTITEAQPAGLCKKTASAPCKTEAIMIS